MRLTVDQIRRVTEDHYGLPKDALLKRTRRRSVAFPRQVAAYLAKQYTPNPLREIGKDLGGLSHTTLIHGMRTVEKEAKTSPKVRWDLGSLHVAIGLLMDGR